MKRAFLAGTSVILVLAFTLVARTTDATASTDINLWEPISGTVWDDCTGEDVSFTGQLHTVIHTTLTTTGIHFDDMDNTADVKGVGIPSGTSYVISDVSHDILNLDGATWNTTTFDRYHITSVAALPNYYLFVHLHLTFNGTTVSAFVDDLKTGCTG